MSTEETPQLKQVFGPEGSETFNRLHENDQDVIGILVALAALFSQKVDDAKKIEEDAKTEKEQGIDIPPSPDKYYYNRFEDCLKWMIGIGLSGKKILELEGRMNGKTKEPKKEGEDDELFEFSVAKKILKLYVTSKIRKAKAECITSIAQDKEIKQWASEVQDIMARIQEKSENNQKKLYNLKGGQLDQIKVYERMVRDEVQESREKFSENIKKIGVKVREYFEKYKLYSGDNLLRESVSILMSRLLVKDNQVLYLIQRDCPVFYHEEFAKQPNTVVLFAHLVEKVDKFMICQWVDETVKQLKAMEGQKGVEEIKKDAKPEKKQDK